MAAAPPIDAFVMVSPEGVTLEVEAAAGIKLFFSRISFSLVSSGRIPIEDFVDPILVKYSAREGALSEVESTEKAADVAAAIAVTLAAVTLAPSAVAGTVMELAASIAWLDAAMAEDAASLTACTISCMLSVTATGTVTGTGDATSGMDREAVMESSTGTVTGTVTCSAEGREEGSFISTPVIFFFWYASKTLEYGSLGSYDAPRFDVFAKRCLFFWMVKADVSAALKRRSWRIPTGTEIIIFGIFVYANGRYTNVCMYVCMCVCMYVCIYTERQLVSV